jgi:hypothetical protein
MPPKGLDRMRRSRARRAGQDCVGLAAQERAHVVAARSGAGSMPTSLRICHIVEAAIFVPGIVSSP